MNAPLGKDPETADRLGCHAPPAIGNFQPKTRKIDFSVTSRPLNMFLTIRIEVKLNFGKKKISKFFEFSKDSSGGGGAKMVLF